MKFFKKNKETKDKGIITKMDKNQLLKVIGGVDTNDAIDTTTDATKTGTTVTGQKAKAWMVAN